MEENECGGKLDRGRAEGVLGEEGKLVQGRRSELWRRVHG